MDPSVGGSGDPWDHPALLASIDDLCSAHFRTTNRSDNPSNLIPGTTNLPTPSKLFSRPSAQNLTGSTEQDTLGGACQLVN